MVVIAILGILAAIALPRLGGFRENARIAADEAFAKSLAQAVDMYNASHPDTPITIPASATGVAFSTLDLQLSSMVENDKLFESDKYKGGVPTLEYNASGNAKVTNGTDTVWEP